MREFVTIIIGAVIALTWSAIWALMLHLFHIPAFTRTAEERESRRERLRLMGKLRYILVFGVLGVGLAFGLGITVVDLLDHRFDGWLNIVEKLALLSVLLGWYHGATTWSGLRGPVPFPPDYPKPRFVMTRKRPYAGKCSICGEQFSLPSQPMAAEEQFATIHRDFDDHVRSYHPDNGTGKQLTL